MDIYKVNYQKCNIRNYLIGTNVKVKAYIDSTNCCEGSRDYNECKGVLNVRIN